VPLFANLPSYQDKIVTVRGIFFFGLRQRDCPHEFAPGNYKWPTALNLVDSSYPADKHESPVGFMTDEASLNGLELLAVSQGRMGRREEIWVTIQGRLRGPQRQIRPGVKGGVGGYGHLGVFAAELVVKRVLDVQIKPQPTYDYSEMLRPHL
jgi:hypothetical protein